MTEEKCELTYSQVTTLCFMAFFVLAAGICWIHVWP